MRRFSPQYCIELDGTADYLTCGTGFNFTDGAGTDQAFSISGWVYFTDATSRGILSKRSVWELALNPSDQLVCNIYTSGVIYIGRTTAALTSLQNQWVHVAMTYSGGETSASVKLYVNGAQSDTANSEAGVYTGMPSNSTTVTMGALDATLRWFGGYMGGLRVWSKELSLAEVKEDMIIEDHNFHSAKSSIRNWWAPETFDGTTLQDRKGGVNASAVSMSASSRVLGGPYPYRHQTRGDGETPVARFGGMAWDFAGTNEYITIPDSASLSAPSALSVSAWVTQDTSAGSKTIVSKFNTSNQREFQMYQTATVYYFFITDPTATNYITLTSSFVPVFGAVYHICATWNGGLTTADLDFYVNGVSMVTSVVETGTFPGLTNGTAPVMIGGVLAGGTPANFWDGKIMDVAMFNVGLTASQVLQIYNNGQPRDLTKSNLASSLIGYWRGYNSTNTASGVLDQSGNANHGTMTNMEDSDLAGADRNYPVKVYDTANVACFSFGGTNEYANNTSLSIDNIAQFSFSCWVRTTTTSGYIVSFPETSGGSNGCDLFINGSGQARGSINTTSYSDINGGTAVVINDGKWHNLVWAYDGARVVIYVDGKESLSFTKAGNISTAANEINIARFGTFGSYFIGRINHVGVWNTGLNTLEAAEIYNNGTPSDLTKHTKYANMIHWYKFNNLDSATGTVSDEVGSSDLTCTNMEAGDKETTNYPT